MQFTNNEVIVRKISFNAPISGYEALRLTGLELITESNSFGLMICGIGGLGDPAGSCFSSGFWSSYYWDGTTWATYMVGAEDSIINDGAVELWSWQPGFVSLNLPSTRPFTAAANGLEWLQSQQSATDGGYGNSSGSVETLLALGANKLKADEWRRQPNSPSLLNYVLTNGAAFANSNVAASGKLAVSLASANSCWPPEAKQPLNYSATGAFSSGGGPQAWAILGTRALSQSIPALAAQNLRGLAQPNGGWEWSPTWGTDTNSTALAIQAILAAGEPSSSSAIVNGLNYLDKAQNSDGGFPYDPDSTFDTTSDANSTAYVIQALLAAGQVPTSTRWTTGSGKTPLSYLLSRQLSNGSFEWQAGQGADQVATRQAVPALLGQPFPLQPSELHQCSEQEMGLSNVYLPLLVK
ncbi:MAG: hypothetical protein HC875_10060 [Anaerolineales bacterium]|nr:hypothetical protein [Anaerolineales bacterium]